MLWIIQEKVPVNCLHFSYKQPFPHCLLSLSLRIIHALYIQYIIPEVFLCFQKCSKYDIIFCIKFYRKSALSDQSEWSVVV